VTRAAGIATNRGGCYPAEDLVTGVFSFRSGVEGVGVWNYYDSFQDKDQVEIIGTAGALRFSWFVTTPAITWAAPTIRPRIERSSPRVELS
jgi:hypothetical protein